MKQQYPYPAMQRQIILNDAQVSQHFHQFFIACRFWFNLAVPRWTPTRNKIGWQFLPALATLNAHKKNEADMPKMALLHLSNNNEQNASCFVTQQTRHSTLRQF